MNIAYNVTSKLATESCSNDTVCLLERKFRKFDQKKVSTKRQGQPRGKAIWWKLYWPKFYTLVKKPQGFVEEEIITSCRLSCVCPLGVRASFSGQW